MAFTITQVGSTATLVGTSGTDSSTLAAGLTTITANAFEGSDDINLGANAQVGSSMGFGANQDTLSSNSQNITDTSVRLGDGADFLTNVNGVGTSVVTRSTILGGGGADTIDSTATGTSFQFNTSLIRGGQGTDTINIVGGGNFNTVVGGSEVDTITLNTNNVFANGQVGNDIITVGGGSGTVRGGSENDTITVTGGTASIFGDNGSDTIQDQVGGLAIDGGAGVDRITASATSSVAGGTGADVFTFATQDTATAATATAAGFATGDVIVFGGGIAVTQVTDFEATDTLVVGVPANPFGGTANALTTTGFDATNVAANGTFFLSGNFDEAIGSFTVTNDGAGADTLILTAATGDNYVAGALQGSFLLNGFNSAGLTAGQFI